MLLSVYYESIFLCGSVLLLNKIVAFSKKKKKNSYIM